MGVKDSFMGASTLNKVALVLALVANIFSWISFTTTSWQTSDGGQSETRSGLWRICTDQVGGSCSFTDGTGNDAYGATQAFAIFGYVALNIGFFLLIAVLFLESYKGNAEMVMASAVSMFVSGVGWILAVIIYAAEFDRAGADFGYSFVFAILALILAVVAGVLIIVGRGGGAVSSN